MTGLDWRAWGAVMELDSGREAPRVGWRRPIEVEPLSVYDRRGDGHTLSRHCGNSPEMEAERLGRHPQLPATGSFPDAATAQRAVEACVAANRGTVELWRRGARSRLAISHDMGEVVGDVLLRGRLLAGTPHRCRPRPCGWCCDAIAPTARASPCSRPTPSSAPAQPILAIHEHRRFTRVPPGDPR